MSLSDITQKHEIKITEEVAEITEKEATVTTKTALIPNKGTGAGGAGTNETGLCNEKKTSLEGHHTKPNTEHDVVFHTDINNTPFKVLNQGNLLKLGKKYLMNEMDSSVIHAHGCKNPDECFICMATYTMIIIEKKFQRSSGSVCEKIQTAGFKRRHYNKLFPNFNVIYIYCLSDWFKDNCKAELEYLDEINIPVFWGDSNTYADDIVSFILNNSK